MKQGTPRKGERGMFDGWQEIEKDKHSWKNFITETFENTVIERVGKDKLNLHMKLYYEHSVT